MSVSVEVLTDLFPAIAALVVPATAELLAAVAEDRFNAAQASSPVDTGAMQADHAWELTGPMEAEISVQKGTAASGGKTYSFFVDSGTIHQSAQPWFTTAMDGTGDAFAARGTGYLERGG